MSLKNFENFLLNIPEVKSPERKLDLKSRFKWTLIALVLYFIMANTMLYGFDRTAENYFKNIQVILASNFGTLMTLGIGPIVTASIVLQLLVGGKILRFDLSNPRDRLFFNNLQKFLAIVFTVFEAAVLVFTNALPAEGNRFDYKILIILQLAIAGTLLIYLDEVVTKYGIGSGIGLFILGSVSQEIAWRGFNPFSTGEAPDGLLPRFIYTLIKGYPDFLLIIPFIATITILAIVIYLEGVRIEIPIAYGRFMGMKTRFPIKFIYASVIPVIFASILMANVQLWARILENLGYPILGHAGTANTSPTGIVKYFTIPSPIYSGNFDPIHAFIYSIILISLAIIFSIFWVELTNMNAKAVAMQLKQFGFTLPGFRSDTRVLEQILQRYIPVVTILGGATVGFLAAFGDVTGALGGGTGLLLTVGILHRMYEEIAREKAFEMFPALKKIFGE